MGETAAYLALTPKERQIISTLRDLPASPLRDLLEEALLRLVDFAREPHCPEMQADGVPCPTPQADCEQCVKLKEILANLVHSLPPL